MTNQATALPKLPGMLSRAPFYYGWVMMCLAAFAMVGTLPGRTQGLGLITESLLKDLQIDRLAFAQMNLWATLLGSLFCIGVGRLQDQLGSRVILTVVAGVFGGVVLAFGGPHDAAGMFGVLLMSRGPGV